MKILEVINLCFKVDNKEVLKNVNFVLNKNEYVLLNGLNGSGKSTFLKLLANDIDAKSYCKNQLEGSILDENGKNILLAENQEEFCKKICYIPQEDVFVGSTILEEFQISLDLAGIKDTEESVYDLLVRMNLLDILKDVEPSLSVNRIFKIKPSKLSGGQKKLVSIISALLRAENSKICLIDEPLNNLDVKHVKNICNLLTYINQELKKAIILVSHCRVFPKITSSYMFVDGTIKSTDNQECFSCFGQPNLQGYYD